MTLIRRYLSYRATEYKRDSAYNPGRRLLIQSWQEKRGGVGWGRRGRGRFLSAFGYHAHLVSLIYPRKLCNLTRCKRVLGLPFLLS